MEHGEPINGMLARIPATTQAGRLRPIMAEIDGRVRAGVGHEAIVAALNASGFDLSLATFRKVLYRWRKKQRLAADEAPRAAASPVAERTVAAPEGRRSPSPAPPVRDRPDLDTVLDHAKRDAIGEKYLARARPIFKPKGESTS